MLQRMFWNPLEFHELFPRQKLIAEDPANTIVVAGGNRSGKTELIADLILRRMLQTPKTKVWASAETFQDSVAIQQAKIWELVPKDQISYGTYDEINGFRNRKIRLKNKSMIVFKSYDQGREAYQGDKIDINWFDEEPPWDIYRESRMRLIDRNGKMILSMTALKGLTDLVQEIIDDAENVEMMYAPLVGEELPRIMRKGSIKIYTLWTTENDLIDQSRVKEEVELMTKDEIKVRIYGIPTAMTGKIYPMFNKDIHCVSWDFIPKSGVCLYNILDPHDIRPWAMQWWAVHRTGTAYLIHEYPWGVNFNDIQTDDKSYDEYVKIIQNIELKLAREFGRSVSIRIIDPNFGNKTVKLAERVDNTGLTTAVRELSKRGLRYHDAVDDVEEGHLQVRKWLAWKKNEAGEIVQQPKAYFYEECHNTIAHISKYSRKDIIAPDGDLKAKVQLTEKWKDYADTTRYFMMNNPKFIPRAEIKQPMLESERRY